MSTAATARQRLLRALQAAGDTGCTTATLCHPSVAGERFGARILELRQDGWTITASYVRRGSFRYTLAGAPGAAPAANRGRDIPVTPASPRALYQLGEYHRCDACGHAWHQRPWPRQCPSCEAAGWWVASFLTLAEARQHVPLALVETAAAA